MAKKYQLINDLARKGQTFSFEDAANTSSLPIKSLRVLLTRMEKAGIIERIEKGKYLIIPLGARKGEYTVNEYIIGSQLIQPAVIAYWSALNYHGFTEQMPGTIFIQTTSRKKQYFLSSWNSSLRHQLKEVPEFEPIFKDVLFLLNKYNNMESS